MSMFGFKKRVKSLFNIGKWIGVKSIRENGQLIHSLVNILIRKSDKSVKHRSFEEAAQYFQLDDETIKQRQNHFKHMSWIYGIILVFGLCYECLLAWQQKWGALVMMTSFNFMIFAFFFRESFWYLQMRERQLGLTFKDWLTRM